MSARITHTLIAAILGCILAASGAALAATSGGASSDATSTTQAAATLSEVPPSSRDAVGGNGASSAHLSGVISVPDRVDMEAFAVLRRSRTGADELPASVHVAFSASSGANVALSRKVQTSAGVAYVIPGHGAMCVMSGPLSERQPGTGGAGCVPDAAATAGYLEMEETNGYDLGTAARAMVFVSGLVPDGIGRVTLHLADGGTAVVPVHENVYMQQVRGPVSDVTFSGPEGVTTVGRR